MGPKCFVALLHSSIIDTLLLIIYPFRILKIMRFFLHTFAIIILKKFFLAITLMISLHLLGGCAPILVTGAATSAVVAQDRRTAGTMVDDQTLHLKAIHAISLNTELWKQSHIHIVSYNNNILLVGQTPTEAYRQLAAQAVAQLPKVRKVHNELKIGAPIPLITRANDSWITTQVKAKIFAAKDIHATQVKVITEDSVVYLLGLLKSPEEQIAIDIARRIKGVKEVIFIFEPALPSI